MANTIHANRYPTEAGRIRLLEETIDRQREQIAQNNRLLQAIYSSHGWKVLAMYYRMRARLVPDGSWRNSAARMLFRVLRRVNRQTGRLRNGSPQVEPIEEYDRWILTNEPSRRDLEAQRLTRFRHQPRISIVVPTYETPDKFLRAMLESVIVQTYGNWELCVADGGSRKAHVRRLLEEAARGEPRIKVRFLEGNLHIAGNSNAALELAEGEFVAMLDHDDTLAPCALFEIVRAINENPEVDVLYSDEDCITADSNRRLHHNFKPDWSPDTLRSFNYICHLAVFRRSLVDKIGGFRPGFDGSQDHDLTLRATEQARQIVHIPKVLYHWRMHGESTAGSATNKMYAHEAGRKAVAEHLDRTGTSGVVRETSHRGIYQVVYSLDKRPLVSIIIPNRDEASTLAKCVLSIARSSYGHYEILIVENHSLQADTFTFYQQLSQKPKVRILTWGKPFNYSAVNNFAASQAQGEVLLFLNNDVEVINDDWLERMLEHAVRPGVGAVGAKLYYPDNTIQHAGLVVDTGAPPDHHHRNFPRHVSGYASWLVSVRNAAAVTGACLMISRRLFEEVGGFDEAFVLTCNDIDLCLKLRQRGQMIVWTPFAELYHHECKTRGRDDTPEKQAFWMAESTRFHKKWADLLATGDPFFNPNLALRSDKGFGLRFSN